MSLLLRLRARLLAGAIMVLIILAAVLLLPLAMLFNIPGQQAIIVGEKQLMPLSLPGLLADQLHLELSGDPALTLEQVQSGYQLNALRPGRAELKLRLFGHIPVRTIEVQSLPSHKVMAGGHSIGVILQSDGIMVVGFATIKDNEGRRCYPAREQGIAMGDLLYQVDEQNVRSENELASLIDATQGRPFILHLKRNGQMLQIPLQAVYCAETDRFRVGLYVRDSVVGVGTLSFWDPGSGRYAALGHCIEDNDAGVEIDIRQGRLVAASIQTIKRGQPGSPGEKIGMLDENGDVNGNIICNNEYGITGQMTEPLQNSCYERSIDLAYAYQVDTGPAQLLTVVSGDKIEAFDIEIVKLYPQRQDGKGMVIRVTDRRLIDISGGIVQGMSGSPIIQNERLVGVITHVFLNDPLSGYATFADQIMSNLMAKAAPADFLSTNSAAS